MACPFIAGDQDRYGRFLSLLPTCVFIQLLVSGGVALRGCQHDIRLNEEGSGFGKWGGRRRKGWNFGC